MMTPVKTCSAELVAELPGSECLDCGDVDVANAETMKRSSSIYICLSTSFAVDVVSVSFNRHKKKSKDRNTSPQGSVKSITRGTMM